MEWNEEKAQNIIKKHKNRFSLRLTFKVIRVTVALFVLFTVYMVVLTASYDMSKIGKRTELYQKLAIDWTYPELTTGVGIDASKEITPFLTQKIEIPLVRTIGSEEYIVSQLSLSKPLLNSLTRIEIAKSYPYGTGNQGFYFNLPYDPASGKQLNGDYESDVWDTLERIHEGNVADMAFSTTQYHAPEDIIALLAPYDIAIQWMPLYMGELKQFTEGGWGGGEDSMSLLRTWGLSGGRLMDDDLRGGSLTVSINENWVEEDKKAMLTNMDMMLNNHKRLAETLLETDYLQERYDYLQENGFQAYGAVVTGPVKELLKLKEVEGIQTVMLGEVKYWNWTGKQ